jgi:hypothetical protein
MMWHKVAFSLLAVFLVHASFMTIHPQQNTDPIEKTGLLAALEKEALSSKELIDQVKRRGVNFEMDAATEREIRAKGGYLGGKGVDDLITAIRNLANVYNSTPLASPSPIIDMLVPANDAIPDICDPRPSGTFMVLFGNQGAWTYDTNITILRIGGEDMISVQRGAGGIYLSAIVRGSDDRIIAKVTKNVFSVRPDPPFTVKTPDKHTIVVLSPDHEQLLYVRYMNTSVIAISGVFYHPGSDVVVVRQGMHGPGLIERSGNCFSNAGPVLFNYP